MTTRKETNQIKTDELLKRLEKLQIKNSELKVKAQEQSGGSLKSLSKMISSFDPIIENWSKSLKNVATDNLLSPENIVSFQRAIEEAHCNSSREDLLKALTNAISVSYRLKMLLDMTQSNFAHLFHLQLASHKKEKSDQKNRIEGKKFLHSVDKERIEECIKSFLKRLGREPLPTDFPDFVTHLKSKYPYPIYLKRPRLTPAEKLLPIDEQDECINDKSDPNWKESTLRKEWTFHTKLKAQRRKSLLKS